MTVNGKTVKAQAEVVVTDWWEMAGLGYILKVEAERIWLIKIQR